MDTAYEQLPDILQHIGDLVFIADTEGRVIDHNLLWERLLGYSREEIIGRSLTDFWVNEKECCETLSWVVAEASSYVSNLEVHFRRKTGGELDLSLTLSKFRNGNGTVLGVIGIARDITEKKKVESALRVIHQELENFINTISHDLKSPVLSIEGYTSILLREYHDRLDEKGRYYLERIQWNINMMGMLLRDLLELSRSGRAIGDLTEVDTGDVISAVLREMGLQIKRSGITVVFSNNFPRVWCDKYRLFQVFENLLSNAIKFMGDQSKPRIDVGYHDRDGYHEFFVKDNGIGIDPLYNEKVFGIFQRLEQVPAEGTGVGLTIAKRIVKNHGGRMWVVSEPKKGATFYFTIPKKTK